MTPAAYTVTPVAGLWLLTMADGRNGLFATEADAERDGARLVEVDARGVWGMVRGYVNKERL